MKLIELFRDFYYLDETHLSHTISIKDKIIDKECSLLVRQKESGVMIYSLYSSTQIFIPIDYINIFLSFVREEGDRLSQIKTKGNIDGFIVSCCYLVKSIFYNVLLGKEAVSGIIKYRSIEFRDYIKDNFKINLPLIILENIGGRVSC